MAKVQYLFDEHLPWAIVRPLRRRGVDVLTAGEAGLIGAPDAAYLERARATGRVLVTQDRDFLRLQGRGEQHNGIVYSARGSRSIGQILAGLVLIYDLLESAEMAGRIEFI